MDLKIRHASPAFRTFCGDDALTALPRELARAGARRAVIVCGPSIVKHQEALSRVHDALGERLVGQFDGVAEHSPLPVVEQARQFLADHDADSVIAVGGGSAVVTARAASILLAERRDVRQLCTRRDDDGKLVSPRLTAPKLPQWVVPSTPTTAYAKAGSAVRDPETGERLALYDPKIRAQGVLLDPAMALTAPPRLIWSAALNVFAMAVEGLQSRHIDPLADAQLAHALRTVAAWLPQLPTDPEAARPRLHLMLAALMSGQGSDHTGGGLAQALSHAVGPRSSVANGVVEALLLPHAMRFNAAVVGHRLAMLADILGLADRSAEAVIAKVERLLELFEVPTRLRDVDVTEKDLVEAADHALDDWAITSGPRVPDRADVLAVLTNAW
ncbi:iron-containing alcohol dehydrogenase family protein [Streptomyces violarus]|uniref:iron-containing alcohol dehydrogenase family protein n=1 Tax=Streptomyces violarus TaxID=67380 RepID=UPI0021C1E587|nr:iron-containing alcohol dehydrogenase family protein [Streptomyces violarus]MCT9137574.1 iron-containing alcohol dehydrogenase family protein [Streptomyces violarus]